MLTSTVCMLKGVSPAVQEDISAGGLMVEGSRDRWVLVRWYDDESHIPHPPIYSRGSEIILGFGFSFPAHQ